METKHEVQITLEEFKLIKQFYPDFHRKQSPSNDFIIGWSELMPLVEKISHHIYESYPDHNGYKEVTVHDRAYPRTFGMIDNEGKWMVRINRMPLEQEETLIEATYKAVVEWIKYNQPQKAS